MTVTSVANSTALSAANQQAAASASVAQQYTTFLTMLTTQLKNQNPLDPLDTNQFTQQLVQFASVEQQIKQNETLSALLVAAQSDQSSSAMGFLGTKITAVGTMTQLGASGTASWQLNAAQSATATITIKDADGNVVFSETDKALSSGSQAYEWDGRLSDGGRAPAGYYTISISAKDNAGATVKVDTDITGVVDGIDFSDGTAVLKVGTQRIPVSWVKQVDRTGS